MVDKKTDKVKPIVAKKNDKSKPIIVKDSNVNETKAERFIRIANPRIKKILKRLTVLGNCSNRINYEYTIEQVDKIFNALQETLNDTRAKFTKSKKEVVSFEL